MIIGDYHVHTPFCPHGTTDTLNAYVESALNKGFKEISFTEHAPLPLGFIDPTPAKDSGLAQDKVARYIETMIDLKATYKNELKINVGFEVDFIEGFESETRQFLDHYGPWIDDAILSVHMLKDPYGQYHCLDYSVASFGDILRAFVSLEEVYAAYFKTVALSLESDLGMYKPMRLGHITLVEKFKRQYPYDYSHQLKNQITALLKDVKAKGYSLDLNTAGLFKPDCLTMYPNPVVFEEAKALGISFKAGSDAHQSRDVGRAFDLLELS